MTPLSCAFVLAACSVYSEGLLDGDTTGPEAGGTKSGGDSVPPSAGSGGRAGTPDGGKSGTGSTGASGAAPGAAGMPEAEAGSPGQDGGAGSDGGASGSDGGGGSAGGSAGSGGMPPVTPSGDLLDGFEDQDLILEQASGRGGVWYLFNDGTVGSAGPAPLVCSALLEAPAALGSLAMHITATGFTSWGSGLGADFRTGRMVYDGSKHSGIRFWARVGEGKNTRHRLQLADGTTDPLGGKCDPASNAVDGAKCADHFGINQTFTTTWTQYVVPFSALSQVGWGKAAAALDKTALYGLQVTAEPNLEVDLWLDQFEFF